MFSNKSVAKYINEHFEPAWQTVRPVPTVTIDFGNGKTVQRTLNGNIATYVCLADGRVLDILPGIYEPIAYRRQLEQLQLLAKMLQPFATDAEQFAENLRYYHSELAAARTSGESPPVLREVQIGRSITGAELGTKIVLEPEERLAARSARRRGHDVAPILPIRLGSAQELSEWKALADDTEINERQRRQRIHSYLSEHAKIRPDEITKWLYREVLNTDLDDPYLGLGKLLFGK